MASFTKELLFHQIFGDRYLLSHLYSFLLTEKMRCLRDILRHDTTSLISYNNKNTNQYILCNYIFRCEANFEFVEKNYNITLNNIDIDIAHSFVSEHMQEFIYKTFIMPRGSLTCKGKAVKKKKAQA